MTVLEASDKVFLMIGAPDQKITCIGKQGHPILSFFMFFNSHLLALLWYAFYQYESHEIYKILSNHQHSQTFFRIKATYSVLVHTWLPL